MVMPCATTRERMAYCWLACFFCCKENSPEAKITAVANTPIGIAALSQKEVGGSGTAGIKWLTCHGQDFMQAYRHPRAYGAYETIVRDAPVFPKPVEHVRLERSYRDWNTLVADYNVASVFPLISTGNNHRFADACRCAKAQGEQKLKGGQGEGHGICLVVGGFGSVYVNTYYRVVLPHGSSHHWYLGRLAQRAQPPARAARTWPPSSSSLSLLRCNVVRSRWLLLVCEVCGSKLLDLNRSQLGLFLKIQKVPIQNQLEIA